MLDLRDDGTVMVPLGAKEVRLRAPTVGEWKQLWEEFERAAEKAEAREDMSAASFAADSPFADWLQMAVLLLGEGSPAVEFADLPAWAITAEVAPELLEHWMSVPLARGALAEKRRTERRQQIRVTLPISPLSTDSSEPSTAP